MGGLKPKRNRNPVYARGWNERDEIASVEIKEAFAFGTTAMGDKVVEAMRKFQVKKGVGPVMYGHAEDVIQELVEGMEKLIDDNE